MYKILIADDELVIRNSLKKLINKTELPVSVLYSVSNGEDVLKCLLTSPCDICFIDINMPKTNGIDVLNHIKKLDKQLYTIVISGYDSFSYAQQAINLGARKYILKPFSFTDLKNVLNEAIAEIEKTQNKYTISLLDSERSVSEIVNCITENSPLYRQAVQSIVAMIKKSEPPVALKFAREFTEIICNRLSFNMGFNVSYAIKEYDSYDVSSIICTFLYNIDLIYSSTNQMYQNIQDNIISQAVSILDKGEDFSLTVDNIADSFGYNPLYFGRLFKKITGESFTQYKAKKCVKHAAYLLLNTNMSITEIAHKLNFNDSAYFSTIFKKQLSCSPKTYRERKGIIKGND